jgi:hypothetical protein
MKSLWKKFHESVKEKKKRERGGSKLETILRVHPRTQLLVRVQLKATLRKKRKCIGRSIKRRIG